MFRNSAQTRPVIALLERMRVEQSA